MQKQMYVFLNTDGTGYWSDVAKKVLVEYIALNYEDDDGDFGELCVKFNTQTWDVEQDGLIYTDKLFMQELKNALMQNGFSKAAADDVSYSEQGMQGKNYVSCDVGGDFIKAFKTNAVLADVMNLQEKDYLDA